jgi:hypothetical protein
MAKFEEGAPAAPPPFGHLAQRACEGAVMGEESNI